MWGQRCQINDGGIVYYHYWILPNFEEIMILRNLEEIMILRNLEELWQILRNLEDLWQILRNLKDFENSSKFGRNAALQ